MMEVQWVPHTVKSHGAKVAKTHMHDWLIFLLLGLIDIILNVIDPFYGYVGKDMMTDLKYPFKSNTVPIWAVPDWPVILYSSTAVITDSIKIAVGQPRPNFFWRFFPDGVEVYDHLENAICHGEKHVIMKGTRVFQVDILHAGDLMHTFGS